jgi:hypothetical protein
MGVETLLHMVLNAVGQSLAHAGAFGATGRTTTAIGTPFQLAKGVDLLRSGAATEINVRKGLLNGVLASLQATPLALAVGCRTNRIAITHGRSPKRGTIAFRLGTDPYQIAASHVKAPSREQGRQTEAEDGPQKAELEHLGA